MRLEGGAVPRRAPGQPRRRRAPAQHASSPGSHTGYALFVALLNSSPTSRRSWTSVCLPGLADLALSGRQVWGL